MLIHLKRCTFQKWHKDLSWGRCIFGIVGQKLLSGIATVSLAIYRIVQAVYFSHPAKNPWPKLYPLVASLTTSKAKLPCCLPLPLLRYCLKPSTQSVPMEARKLVGSFVSTYYNTQFLLLIPPRHIPSASPLPDNLHDNLLLRHCEEDRMSLAELYHSKKLVF